MTAPAYHLAWHTDEHRMKLTTEYVHPPVPFRDSDWCCYDADTYDGAPDAGRQIVGWGRTEEAAKADFWELWMERESERDCTRAVDSMKVWDGVMEKLFRREFK